MTNEEAFLKAKLNPELEDFILSEMPKNLNKIEISLYLYAKLCMTLNYDPEYSATMRGDGPKQQVHSNIDNISNISLTNTDVICYDFNIIFGKFLEKFDIDFVIKGYTPKSNNFGNHSDIHIKIDQKDCPVELGEDFIYIIFTGHTDMKRMKVNEKLSVGPNHNQGTESFHKYFDKTRSKMEKTVKEELDKEKAKKAKFFEDDEKLQELSNKFLESTPDFIKLDEKEALEMFVKSVKKVDMNRYDASFFIEKIFKNTFSESKDKLFTYSILKEQSKKNPEIFNMIAILNITSDNDDFFLKITPPNEIQNISKKELQEDFDNGKIDYIEDLFPGKAILPGIKSKTVEKIYGANIKKFNISKSIKEIHKIIDDIDLPLPDIRLMKYASNFHNTEKKVEEKSFEN